MRRRLGLIALREKARQSEERTQAAREKKKKRRNKVKVEAQESDGIPDFGGCTNGGQELKRVVTSEVVKVWFREELHKNFGDRHEIPPLQGWWSIPEMTLAKKMLGLYEAETIRRTIVYLCENWDAMVEYSEGRLSGLPGMRFLWATKERLVADMEAGRKPTEPKKRPPQMTKNFGEYIPRDEEDDIGVGWGK